MATIAQTYRTHRKFVPLFHYVALPILLVNVFVTAYGLVRDPGLAGAWALAVATAIFLAGLFARVFALGAQDRVIRLEERLRMREVLPPDLRGRIHEFSREQIIGLRFASDAELPELAAMTLRDSLLKRDAIKKLIKQWRADDHQL